MQLSDLLSESIKTLEHNIVRDGLTKNSKARLLNFSEKLEELKIDVLDFEELIRLNVEAPKKQFHCISSFDSKIDIRNPKSNLLDYINKAGLDIKNIGILDEKKVSLSVEIAKNFSRLSPYLKSLRGSQPSKKGNNRLMDCSGGPNFNMFTNLMSRAGIIDVNSLMIQKGGKFQPIPKRLRTSTSPKQKLRVSFSVVNQNLYYFVFGDWMTNFAGFVVHDHLVRNKISHEVFTKVRFSAPTDVHGINSDFDVISLIEDRVLCFECKSGQIDGKLCKKVIENAEMIDDVVTRFGPGKTEFEHYLVYDEQMTSTKEIQKFLANTRITPLLITDIRELVHSKFN